MALRTFIEKLNTQPELVEFTETMATIDHHYDFHTSGVKNANTFNLSESYVGICIMFVLAL